MIVSSQAADALHLASVLQSYDASSAKALIQASLTLHGLALHNLTKAATAAGTANAVVNVQEQVNPADIQPFTDTEAATAAEAAKALLNVQDIAGVDAPTVNLCKRIATVEQGQPKRPPEQLLRALHTPLSFTDTEAATAAEAANALLNVQDIAGVDAPTVNLCKRIATAEQGQLKDPPTEFPPSDARLRAARARADGEETIHPGDQWFNRECPAGASNPSPTPLGKRTASGASSIVLQPSAKKVTRSVASAWASEADKYWAHINYLDYENVPPKPMENLSPHNKLSDPQTFTFDAELTNNAGWRGRESSKWSVYRRGYRSYFRSPDGEVYRSLIDCRRAHYRQQLAMFDDLGSLKSFGSNSLGSLGAIEEFLKMEVGGKEEV
jgi:hypothetical protein